VTPTPARNAIGTGAARGIGAAVARRLARDGFAVAAVDLRKVDCDRPDFDEGVCSYLERLALAFEGVDLSSS
jgi:NAD(P)-dependent dehydrogenase (short-subunit alcohol dehydrogenase family)